MKLSKKQRSQLSTIMGAVVAVATAWVTIDWANFAFDFKSIAPLVLSGLVALGGYLTTINGKDESTK
jgi:hypothetical protein